MYPNKKSSIAFSRLADHAVEIKPFDPKNKQNAIAYCNQLNWLLGSYGVSAELFGSTELEIATRGEWEYALYLTDDSWFPVLIHLINHYGAIQELTNDRAVFMDMSDDIEIEVVAMRGDAAIRNKALMKYWKQNPSALEEYQRQKYAHSHSKSDYTVWKENFINQIASDLSIPPNEPES